MSVNGGTGGNSFSVLRTIAPVNTTINAGTGNDMVTVSPVAEDLKKRMETVKSLIVLKDYKKATAVLDELQKFVDKAVQPT